MKSKLHRAVVTEADLNYVGSITIDRDLMEAVDLWETRKCRWSIIRMGRVSGNATYAAGSYESIWASLQAGMATFERESASVASQCGFALNEQETARVQQYIKKVGRVQ